MALLVDYLTVILPTEYNPSPREFFSGNAISLEIHRRTPKPNVDAETLEREWSSTGKVMFRLSMATYAG